MRFTILFLVFCAVAVSQCYGSCSGVHYQRFGCFSSFENTYRLPWSPSDINTRFLLYTRDNPTSAEILSTHTNSSIRNSGFNASRPTKILVHGFLQHGHSPFLISMTEALLTKAPMNVIVVAWEGGASFPYSQAVANTRMVGAEIALLLSTLVREKSLNLRYAHIIGHSLGAHVAAYAGQRTPGLGRITGLDPAQPKYSGFPDEVRLDRSDAVFVDVIHTDAKDYNTVGGYGMVEPVGHVDFYPNKGHDQPGCRDETSIIGVLEDAFSLGISGAERGISCSHERSTELFTASIYQSANPNPRHCRFTAVPCSSYDSFLEGLCTHCSPRICPTMGLDANLYRASGVYFLNTTGTGNYCANEYFVTLSIPETSPFNLVAQLSVQLEGTTGVTEWTRVHDGPINPNSTIGSLMLSTTDIGYPTEVKIHATYDRGFYYWIAPRSAAVSQVKVASIMRFLTHTFCGEITLDHDVALVFANGTAAQTDCA